MHKKLKSLLRPVLKRIIKNMLNSIDTTELKNKNIKKNAQKHIDSFVTESIDMLEAIIQYMAYIIEKGSEDEEAAINEIQNNKYGGKFTKEEATQIYKGLNKILSVFDKSLKKFNEKKNISELNKIKKKSGGGNKQLIDKNGNFTDEMNGILNFSGGAAPLAFLSAPLWLPVALLIVVVDKLSGKKVSEGGSWMDDLIEMSTSFIDPYLSGKRRIDKINISSPVGHNQGSIEVVKNISLLTPILRNFKNFFTGPSHDFPSEYDLALRGSDKVASLIQIIGVSILVMTMFIPIPYLSTIPNIIILINALFTNRRLLAVISIINIITSLLIGPYTNVFIQGVLYLFYFLDGQKYLNLYSKYIKNSSDTKKITSRELGPKGMMTTTLKKGGPDGAVVVREESESADEVKKLDKAHRDMVIKLKGLGQGSGSEELKNKILQNRSIRNIEAAKSKAHTSDSYDNEEDHDDIIKASQVAFDKGHISAGTHNTNVEKAERSKNNIQKYKTMNKNTHFKQLYSIYKMYRKALRLAWANPHSNTEHEKTRQRRGPGFGRPSSDNPKPENDYGEDKFLSDILRPIIYNGAVIDRKNPLYFSNEIPPFLGRSDRTELSNALVVLNKSNNPILILNKNFLNVEAIRLINLIRDDPPSPPYPTILDKLLEHIYGFTGDSATMIGALDIQESIRTYLPDDIIPEEWASAKIGGGPSNSILDLYRSPF